MNFVEALRIAQSVLDQYKRDQPKWWRRMDGTPILNDVAVRMAEAFVRADAVGDADPQRDKPTL